MVWQQIYDPFHNMFISTLLAAVPVVVMLVALGFLHIKAHIAAGLGLAGVLLGGVVSILPGSLAAGSGDAAMDVHLLNVTGYSADRMQADERRVLDLFDRRIGSLDAANG